MASLEIRDVEMRFGAVYALRGVSLTLQEGEVRALLGHNGAGKSTLMRIAAGVTQPHQGIVRIGGGTPTSPEVARRLGLRIVHQELSLIETLTVADNIFLNEERLRAGVVISRRAQLRETARLLEGLGIDISPSAVLGDLSRAEREMVEIARALRNKSAVLLLDEPTAPLARPEVLKLYEVIRNAARSKTGIILVTHHIGEVFEICDSITVLRDGRVVMDAKTAEVAPTEVIEAVSGRIAAIPNQTATKPSPGSTKGTLAGSPDGTHPVLKVNGLTVPGKLRSVSFTLHPREIVGLVGLAGSGRSTLMKALVGLVACTDGTVEFRNRVYGSNSLRKAARAGIFRLPEDRRTEGLLLDHPISLNVALARLDTTHRAGIYRRKFVRATAAQLCRRLDMRFREVSDDVATLSGGNQQKVMLARAFYTGSKVLLLDEPTFGVDVGAADDIVRFIREYVSDGGTVLWCSSDLSELSRVVDRALILRDGEIRQEVDNEVGRLSESALLELLGQVASEPTQRNSTSLREGGAQ